MNFTKYLWDKLPYFRYHAHDDNTRTEARTIEASGTGESSEGCEAGGEGGDGGETPPRIKITSEEVRLDGVESVTTYTSPSDPNSPRTAPAPAPHIAVASNAYYRTGELLSYNERTGSCTVIDSHGNLVTINTAGNPFLTSYKR